jgi:hypothetical protein
LTEEGFYMFELQDLDDDPECSIARAPRARCEDKTVLPSRNHGGLFDSGLRRS